MNKKGTLPEWTIDLLVWILLIMFGIGFYLVFLFTVDAKTEEIHSRMMTGSFQPTLHFLNAPYKDGLRNKEFVSNVFRTNDQRDITALLSDRYSIDVGAPLYWQIAVCSTRDLVDELWYLRRGKCFDANRIQQGGRFQTIFKNTNNIQLPDRPYVAWLYAPSSFVEDDPFGASTPP